MISGLTSISSALDLALAARLIDNDEYFQVDHIARPGETLSSSGHASRIGGKGANQAVTIARAGGNVRFFGAVGKDGVWLREKMEGEGVGVGGLVVDEDVPTGRAIIQVDKHGENSIILFPGANHSLLPDQQLTNQPAACTHLLLQNEIQMRSTLAALSSVPPETTVILNPSPIPSREEIKAFPWERVDWLIVNRHEAGELYKAMDVGVASTVGGIKSDEDMNPRELLEVMGDVMPFRKTNIVCTLGADGVRCRLSNAYWDSVPEADKRDRWKSVYILAATLHGDIRDTTGAGDCFAGYFVKGLMDLDLSLDRGSGGKESVVGIQEVAGILRVCVAAAGMCVEKRGTIDSVPTQEEVARRMLLSA